MSSGPKKQGRGPAEEREKGVRREAGRGPKVEKARKKPERTLKNLLDQHISEYLKQGSDVVNTNIVSLLYRAFAETGIGVVEGGEAEGAGSEPKSGLAEDYISKFTRLVALKLFAELDAFDCSHYKGVFSEINKRFDEILGPLSKRYHVLDLRLTTQSRLLVHTRSHHLPLDISVAWDPVLNVPFIPSSTLKGVGRAYCEKVGPGEDLCGEVFGSQDREGSVFFIDSYPIGCKDKLVEPDVITPHYSEVAGAIDEASARPVPVIFFAVSPGVTFRLILLVKSSRLAKINMEGLKRILEGAFESGVGAKTSVGYGRIILSRQAAWRPGV